jgi:hypothetical protein
MTGQDGARSGIRAVDVDDGEQDREAEHRCRQPAESRRDEQSGSAPRTDYLAIRSH